MNPHTIDLFERWKYLEEHKENLFVSVDYNALVRCAAEEHAKGFQTPNWRMEGALAKHDWVFAANSVVINALNFAFNIFETPDVKYCFKKGGFTGALAMAERMYQFYGEKFIQAHDIERLLASHIIRTKYFLDGEECIPLRELRTKCLIEVAEVLEREYGGNPLNILEEAMVWDEKQKRSVWYAFNNGKGIVEILTSKFPVAYGDTWQFSDSAGTHELKFNKKAQLVALLLYGRGFNSKALPPLVDIRAVGPLADYQVPNALRSLGILQYSPELASRIDNWQEIEAGSREELEIRLATVVVCVKLLDEMNRYHAIEQWPLLNISQLDYWLWMKGKQSPFRPHLCRTSMY